MKLLNNLDLVQNELQNARIQNLASAPGSPVQGQLYHNTTDGRTYVRNASAWESIDNYTGAKLLALLLTVDGAASGLDADSLDGQEGSYHLARANHTGTQAASTISDFDTQVRTNRLDQMAAPTASVALNSQKITGLANGTANGDAVNYGQLLASENGTAWKDPVRAIATSNITLSGAQTIDGVSVVATDRVLVAGQTTASENGIYVAAAGAWSRAADLAAAATAVNSAMFVAEGTTYADTQWRCTNNSGSDVVGTGNLTFSQFGAGSSYSADDSTLQLSGSTFSVKNSGITATQLASDAVTTAKILDANVTSGKLASNSVTTAKITDGNVTDAKLASTFVKKYSALIGDGVETSIVITQATHGLAANSQNAVFVYDATSGEQVFPNITIAPASGNVTLGFATAPATNAYRAVIVG